MGGSVKACMNPKKPRDAFKVEQPTKPSAVNPLRSGKHASFRDPSDVIDCDDSASSKLASERRLSAERETIRQPTSWEIETTDAKVCGDGDRGGGDCDDAVATPRPH